LEFNVPFHFQHKYGYIRDNPYIKQSLYMFHLTLMTIPTQAGNLSNYGTGAGKLTIIY